jgi:hypothetical protein
MKSASNTAIAGAQIVGSRSRPFALKPLMHRWSAPRRSAP